MKKCLGCTKTKEYSEFYRDRTRLDGFMNICKDCERLRYREKRIRNIENYRTKDRRYYLKNKAKIAKKRREDYANNKEKHIARERVKVALYKGIIERPKVCSSCGEVKSIDAHHPDYSKPLDVVWLCRECHMRLEFGN